jgi:hypothetical protein
VCACVRDGNILYIPMAVVCYVYTEGKKVVGIQHVKD